MQFVHANAITPAWLSGSIEETWLAIRVWGSSQWLDREKHASLFIGRLLSGQPSEVGCTRLLCLDGCHLHEQLMAISDDECSLHWQLKSCSEEKLLGASFTRYVSSLQIRAGDSNSTYVEWRGEAYTQPHSVQKISAALENWYRRMLCQLQEYLMVMKPLVPRGPALQMIQDPINGSVYPVEQIQRMSTDSESDFFFSPFGSTALPNQTLGPHPHFLAETASSDLLTSQQHHKSVNPGPGQGIHHPASDTACDSVDSDVQLSPSEAWHAAKAFLVPQLLQQEPSGGTIFHKAAAREDPQSSILSMDATNTSWAVPQQNDSSAGFLKRRAGEDFSEAPSIGEYTVTWTADKCVEAPSSTASSSTAMATGNDARRHSHASSVDSRSVNSPMADCTSNCSPFTRSSNSVDGQAGFKSRSGSLSSEASSFRQGEVFSSFVSRSFEATRRSLDRTRLSSDGHRLLNRMSRMGIISETSRHSADSPLLPPWSAAHSCEAFGAPQELNSDELDQRALLFASSLPQVYDTQLRSQLFSQASQAGLRSLIQ